jgi:hypothetical protein
MIINPEGVILVLEYWKDGKLERWGSGFLFILFTVFHTVLLLFDRVAVTRYG